MFYCEGCAKKHGYPYEFYMLRSRGPCEICKTVATCVDVPCSQLPSGVDVQPEPEIPTFTCPRCGATHDRGYFPPGAIGTYRCLKCGYAGPTKGDEPPPREGDVCIRCLKRANIKPHDAATHGTCCICYINYKEDAIYGHIHEIDSIKRRLSVDPTLARDISLRYNCEDLDDHVHELKSKEATVINNAGIEEQIAYLVEAGGEEWVRDLLLPPEEECCIRDCENEVTHHTKLGPMCDEHMELTGREN